MSYTPLFLRKKRMNPNSIDTADLGRVLSGQESFKVEHIVTVPNRTLVVIGVTSILITVFTSLARRAIK